LNKKYIIYGSSIVFSRGLEYVVLFFAAYYMTKSDYGELEFYKKVIEVGSSLFAFGFPALILSYTRGKDSKVHFYLLSILFVVFLGVLATFFLAFTPWLFLVIPFVFYALFFTGGVTHSYFLVKAGSNYASIFKIVVSILFYVVVFCSIYFFEVKGKAFVYVNYVLILPLVIFIVFELKKQQIVLFQLKKYWRLFKGLLFSSFTLVVSNFANLMFLYTDIFVIKLLSKSANVDIANYSFALNISAMLLLIPMTLVQVDIEKLKGDRSYVAVLNKKIVRLTFVATLVLILFFLALTEFILLDYSDVFYLFLIILTAKVVQAFSPLYGTMIVVEKKFNKNLLINLFTLLGNVILSMPLFYVMGIYGIALASLIMLSIRQLFLFRVYNKYS
jgi:O-antigen/teichoic acid export membrane protein